MNFSTPSFHKSDSNVLGSLKSKLGFGDDDRSSRSGRNRADYDDYDDYDDYGDDYGEYGYDEYADDADDYGTDDYAAPYSNRSDDYARVNPVTTRSTTRRSDKGFPNLVSIDDVKAHTTVPERLKRDPLPERKVTSASTTASSSTGRVHVSDDRIDYRHTSTAASDSLASHDAYDPYEAYSGSSAGFSTARSITVVRPRTYGDVSQIASVVKTGDVVVLSLKDTPDDLSKRVLDFSFGVASALDANVETPGDKVFAIAKGYALSSLETQALRDQHVL